MYYKNILFVLSLLIATYDSSAQHFTTGKELKKYYKNNINQFPSPTEGWHEVWIIMPSEKEFNHETEDEVLNARVFLKEGEIVKVFYDNHNYHHSVFSLSNVKKGKASYQKVFLDFNSNLTEVFSAYTHTVIFKDHNAVVEVPLEDQHDVNKMTFFSHEKKIEKEGFFVFVENKNTGYFDFLGYLNKKPKENSKSTDGLDFYLKSGDYEIYSVQNKIQFNRQMPMQKYSISVNHESDHTFEIIAKNK